MMPPLVGSYLFARILQDGEDSRFVKIRDSQPAFFAAFMAQATWVSTCLLPILAVNALPTLPLVPTLLATDVLGLGIFLAGFAFEVIADRQKSQWVADRRAKRHSEEFLTSGLWSKSRHPNYFGEVTLWVGIATCAGGVLSGRVGQLGMGFSGGLLGKLVAAGMCAASPAFAALLVLKVS